MGILSRFKEFFVGKPIETIKELEIDLDKLFKKCDSRLMALIGTGSKIRGLSLIYSATNEDIVRQFSARLSELIPALNSLSNAKKIKDIHINYEDEILYFKPLIENIGFIALYRQKNDILNIQQWINGKTAVIIELFHKN
jgi:hypothetical protein